MGAPCAVDGVLAVAFWVIGTIVRETAVEMKTPATLLDSYRTEEGSILLGGFVWLLGTLSFSGSHSSTTWKRSYRSPMPAM